MKKIAAAFMLICLLTFGGCSGQQAVGFSQSDLVLIVAGKEYHLRDQIETVITNLGEDYQYAEGKSCNYDGLDKTYTYEAATFYTNPLTEGDLLSEIYTKSPEASTSKGIALGASKDDILAVYGQPVEADEYVLVYRAEDEPSVPSLCFELENGMVSAVFLTIDPV